MKFRGTCLFIFLALASNAYAQTAPNLQTAGNFALLGGAAVSNASAGTTIKGGNVGSTTITGPFLSGVNLIGAPLPITVGAGPVLTLAQSDLTTAYLNAKGQAPTSSVDFTSVNLGGLILGPGVYKASSTAQLTGTLTLNGGANSVWIFQIGSGLTTASGAQVAFTGGASPCNVFWQIGSSATIGVGTNFAGVIMAQTSITLVGGTLRGRALAQTGLTSITGLETIDSSPCSLSTPPVLSIVGSPVNSSIVCDALNSSITKTALVTSNGIPVANASVTFTVTAGPDSGLSGIAITNAAGVATFTFFASPFKLTSLLGDTIVATTTLNNTVSVLTSNNTFANCSGSVTGGGCQALAAPTVSVVTQIPGPPKQVIFSVQAPGGLFSLVAVTPPTTNATVVIPPFDNGTTLAVGVIATKINQSKSAVVELTVTDLCGHTTVFDPVFATITIPAADYYSAARSHSQSKSRHIEKFDFDHWEVARFDGIGRTEGKILLQNGTPGVESLVIRVNGSEFRTQLSDGETKKIDISSALFHGTNTVRVAAFGDRRTSVDLTISDGK